MSSTDEGLSIIEAFRLLEFRSIDDLCLETLNKQHQNLLSRHRHDEATKKLIELACSQFRAFLSPDFNLDAPQKIITKQEQAQLRQSFLQLANTNLELEITRDNRQELRQIILHCLKLNPSINEAAQKKLWLQAKNLQLKQISTLLQPKQLQQKKQPQVTAASSSKPTSYARTQQRLTKPISKPPQRKKKRNPNVISPPHRDEINPAEWNQYKRLSKVDVKKLNKKIKNIYYTNIEELMNVCDDPNIDDAIKLKIRLFCLAENQGEGDNSLSKYIADRKENTNRYTHWYSYLFSLFPCFSGYKRQTKLAASRKLVDCMQGDNDFEGFFARLSQEEQGALQQGRLRFHFTQAVETYNRLKPSSLPKFHSS